MANWEKGIIALIANMFCCRLEEGEKSIVLQSFTEGGGQPAYLWVQLSKNKHIKTKDKTPCLSVGGVFKKQTH